MIILSGINDPVIREYLKSDSCNLYAVRIKSLLKSYGGYPQLIDVWYQKNTAVTAYIVRYGGEFVADILSNAGTDEIIDLCRMAGGTALLCKPIFNSGELGIIMQLKSVRQSEINQYSFSDSVSLYDYYDILKANKSSTFTVPCFEDFYADLNHRLRKHSAKMLGCCIQDKLVSCAAATAVYGNSAVIAGVATLPGYKKTGYGTAVVAELCNRLLKENINRIYLQRGINENYKFYHNIGFEDIKKFQQIKLL